MSRDYAALLAEAKQLCDNATPGPWSHDSYGGFINASDTMMVAQVRGWGHLTAVLKLSEDDAIKVQEHNGDFIAHSRILIPQLVAALEDLLKRE